MTRIASPAHDEVRFFAEFAVLVRLRLSESDLGQSLVTPSHSPAAQGRVDHLSDMAAYDSRLSDPIPQVVR